VKRVGDNPAQEPMEGSYLTLMLIICHTLIAEQSGQHGQHSHHPGPRAGLGAPFGH